MNPASISGIKTASAACSHVRRELLTWIHPGLTTSQIDSKAVELIKETGSVSAVYGRSGFPGHICICVNNQVAHFYGQDNVVIKENDLVKIDISLRKESWVADCGASLYFGKGDKIRELVQVNKSAVIETAVSLCPGLPVADICDVIDFERKNFHYYRNLTGHGTGESLHCGPLLSPDSKDILKTGQIIAVEAVFALQEGQLHYGDLEIDSNTLNAHHEETVLITANGSEILTTP